MGWHQLLTKDQKPNRKRDAKERKHEENHQDRKWSAAKKIQGIQCSRESMDGNYVIARVSEKRESMKIGTRNVT